MKIFNLLHHCSNCSYCRTSWTFPLFLLTIRALIKHNLPMERLITEYTISTGWMLIKADDGFTRGQITYTCFSKGRVGSTLSPTIVSPSCGIRNFSGLDRGPGGRRRSVGDEERSHSAPSNWTVGRWGQKMWVIRMYTVLWTKKINGHSQTSANISHPAIGKQSASLRLCFYSSPGENIDRLPSFFFPLGSLKWLGFSLDTTHIMFNRLKCYLTF